MSKCQKMYFYAFFVDEFALWLESLRVIFKNRVKFIIFALHMKYLCSTYNKIIANAIANEIKKRIVTSMTRLSIRICTSH